MSKESMIFGPVHFIHFCFEAGQPAHSRFSLDFDWLAWVNGLRRRTADGKK